jgi:predicted DNA-binding protein (MmcQ/YjbR family)
MEQTRLSARDQTTLARLRKICLLWPETAETVKWGHPVFVAGKKMFAAFGVDHGRPTIGFKLADERWDELVDEINIIPAPYAARFGWVSLWADRKIDWRMLEQLLFDSYRAVALKRMLAQLPK